MILPVCGLLAIKRGWIILDSGQRNSTTMAPVGWIVLLVLSPIDPDFALTNNSLDAISKLTVFGKPK